MLALDIGVCCALCAVRSALVCKYDRHGFPTHAFLPNGWRALTGRNYCADCAPQQLQMQAAAQ